MEGDWWRPYVRVVSTVIAAGLGWACVDLGAFTCTTDGDCVRAGSGGPGQTGRCEAVGHCSYPDTSCPSGSRFSDLAGALADACTPPDDPTTTGDASTSTSTGTGSTSGDADVPGTPVCGDGVVEGDEPCDDGNEVAGDGCNPGCVLSGNLRWSVTQPGAAPGEDVARAVTVLATGGIAVAGLLVDAEGNEDIWVARYDTEGGQVWSLTEGTPGLLDEAYDIVLGSDGYLYVAGRIRSDGASLAWVAKVDGAGEITWTRNPAGYQARAISAFGTRQVVVGDVGNAAFAEAYNLSGTSQWRVETTTDGLPRLDAVDAVGNTQAWVTGRRGGDVWIASVTDSGFGELASHAGSAGGADWGQAIIAVGDTVIVGGLESTPLAADAWLAAFDPEGATVWTYRPEPLPVPVNEEVEGVALDAEGMLMVVGFGTGDDREAWMARVDPQTGTEIWHRRYTELPTPSTARAVAVAPDGTLYVVGELDGPDGTADAWIAAFDP